MVDLREGGNLYLEKKPVPEKERAFNCKTEYYW